MVILIGQRVSYAKDERKRETKINFAVGFCVSLLAIDMDGFIEVCDIENWSKHFHVYGHVECIELNAVKLVGVHASIALSFETPNN